MQSDKVRKKRTNKMYRCLCNLIFNTQDVLCSKEIHLAKSATHRNWTNFLNEIIWKGIGIFARGDIRRLRDGLAETERHHEEERTDARPAHLVALFWGELAGLHRSATLPSEPDVSSFRQRILEKP